MKIGTYSPEVGRASIEEVFRDTKKYGFDCTQFSFMSVVPSDGETDVLTRMFRGDEMPGNVSDSLLKEIKDASEKYDVEIYAVNGTYNMAHKDVREREIGLEHLEEMMKAANYFGAKIITLCAGSRLDKGWQFGWFWDDDNTSQDAWNDLRWSLEKACLLAEKYDLKMGLEIEASTILDTADRTRRMFDEVGSERLGLIYDGGNLFKSGDVSHDFVIDTMKRTFDLFENDIVLIHGKDLAPQKGVNFAPCGKGIVDYDYYMERVKEIGYNGPMIIHGVTPETFFPECVSFMKKAIAKAGL